MSHTTTVKADIRSASAIKKAVAELKRNGTNVVLKENTAPRMYYNNQHKACDYCLHFPDGKYDLGLEKNSDGTYSMVFDTWRGHIEEQVGDSRCADRGMRPVAKFVQTYTKHAAMDAARAKGYIVSGHSIDPKTGEVNLTINVNG